MTYMLDLRLFQAFCICDGCGLKVRVTTDAPPDRWTERCDEGEPAHFCAACPTEGRPDTPAVETTNGGGLVLSRAVRRPASYLGRARASSSLP